MSIQEEQQGIVNVEEILEIIEKHKAIHKNYAGTQFNSVAVTNLQLANWLEELVEYKKLGTTVEFQELIMMQ